MLLLNVDQTWSNKNTMLMRNARSFLSCFNVGVWFWCSTDMFVWIVQFCSSCWCCGCVCSCTSLISWYPYPRTSQIHFWQIRYILSTTVPWILIFWPPHPSTSLVGMIAESWPIFVSGIAEVKALVMQHWSSAVRWKSGVPRELLCGCALRKDFKWNQVTKRLFVKIC